MTRPYRPKGNKQKYNRQPKAKLSPAKPAHQQMMGANRIEVVNIAGGGLLQDQIARLEDGRLQTAQRQALATEIGRVQGNWHLQRVVEASRQRELHQASIGLRKLAAPQEGVVARRTDDGPYTPGEMSERYLALSTEDQAVVNTEVDRRFQAETGVMRQLDPNNPEDQSLINIWLRLRDQVMAERSGEPAEPTPTEPGPEDPQPEEPAGLSYEEAKKQIEAACQGATVDTAAIYTAIRACTELEKLKNDASVQGLLQAKLSGRELWKAQLLLEFGNETAFPDAINEIWAATEGAVVDKARIYQALQALDHVEIAKISRTPGLRDILQNALPDEKDRQAAEALLSGDYAKALAKHIMDIAVVMAELREMKRDNGDLSLEEQAFMENTAEWLEPSDGKPPKCKLYVMTPTHDAEARAKAHRQDKKIAYFGAETQYPDDSADYDAHIDSTRNIRFAQPSAGAEQDGKKIWVYNPKRQGSYQLRKTFIHEIQHVADRHESEEGHGNPLESPEVAWSLYKTEFRAYWIDGSLDYDPNSTPPKPRSTQPGSAKRRGFDNEKQEAIFEKMWGESKEDLYAVWLRPNYRKNTKANGQKFRDLVQGYAQPEGVNLVNSPRIDSFFLQLDQCKPEHTDLTESPLVEMEATANALDANDQAYVNSEMAAPLQEMMKANLEENALLHIAKIINNGSKPDWL